MDGQNESRKHWLIAGGAFALVLLLLPLWLSTYGSMAMTSALVGSQLSEEKKCSSTAVASDTDVNGALVAALSGNQNAALLAQALLEGKGVDLKGLTFSRTMVAGIIGNFYVESGVTFARAEVKDGNHGQMDHMSNEEADAWSRGGARGLGIAQWTWNPGRAGNLIATARAKGRNWYDGDVQVQLIVDELSGAYRNSTYNPLRAVGSPDEAAAIWLTHYEGIGNATLAARQAAARSALEALDRAGVGTVEAGWNGHAEARSLVWRGGTGRMFVVTDCDAGSGQAQDSSATIGAVGGAPLTVGDYSWMCSTSQHVCKNGDAGVFYPHLEYGYQCVWYAWNRLAMIHGSDGWSWVVGDGGQIAGNVVGKPGWTVSDSPQPGDGASGTTQPFAGSTHVAVVEEVQEHPSGWRVRLSEGNFCPANASGCWNGYSGTRWLTKAQMGGIRFFRNSAWK